MQALALHTRDLVVPARRVNPRRQLLLVSTVLGKHIPVAPPVPLAAGAALALRAAAATGHEDPRRATSVAALRDPQRARALWESLRAAPVELDRAPAVLGFAETATALGWATAACLRGATYLHTTRGHELPTLLAFDEEHSHAPEHVLQDRPDPRRPLLLVDDEVTTGRTAHNLATALDRGAACTLLALVDTRSAAPRGAGLGVASLQTIAAGRYSAPAVAVRQPMVAAAGAPPRTVRHMAPRTSARTTVAGTDPGADVIAALATLVAHHREGHRLLCLGTGEFMYLPLLVAAALGDGVQFGATTRSPISVSDAPGYPIRHGLAFVAPQDAARTEYVYNVTPGRWDTVAVFIEGSGAAQRLASLHAALSSAGYDDALFIEVAQP